MKRRLLIAAVFLLAGAVVNVVVAWGCVKWVPLDVTTSSGQDLDWPIQVKPLWPRPTIVGGAAAPGLEMQTGGGGEYDFKARRGYSFFCTAVWAGWPLYSLRMVSLTAATSEGGQLTVHLAESVGSLFAPGERDIRFGDVGAFPTAPVLPGFAVNTLFYAAVLWLLICGPFALRRLIRVKRGLCPWCAYPMGGSAVCSECGKALPSPKVTAT